MPTAIPRLQRQQATWDRRAALVRIRMLRQSVSVVPVGSGFSLPLLQLSKWLRAAVEVSRAALRSYIHPWTDVQVGRVCSTKRTWVVVVYDTVALGCALPAHIRLAGIGLIPVRFRNCARWFQDRPGGDCSESIPEFPDYDAPAAVSQWPAPVDADVLVRATRHVAKTLLRSHSSVVGLCPSGQRMVGKHLVDESCIVAFVKHKGVTLGLDDPLPSSVGFEGRIFPVDVRMGYCSPCDGVPTDTAAQPMRITRKGRLDCKLGMSLAFTTTAEHEVASVTKFCSVGLQVRHDTTGKIGLLTTAHDLPVGRTVWHESDESDDGEVTFDIVETLLNETLDAAIVECNSRDPAVKSILPSAMGTFSVSSKSTQWTRVAQHCGHDHAIPSRARSWARTKPRRVTSVLCSNECGPKRNFNLLHGTDISDRLPVFAYGATSDLVVATVCTWAGIITPCHQTSPVRLPGQKCVLREFFMLLPAAPSDPRVMFQHGDSGALVSVAKGEFGAVGIGLFRGILHPSTCPVGIVTPLDSVFSQWPQWTPVLYSRPTDEKDDGGDAEERKRDDTHAENDSDDDDIDGDDDDDE